MITDDYIASLRRDIEFTATLRDQSYRFRSTWGLFSPREIDAGTQLLAEHMTIDAEDDCIDLGCGYGPIGLVMARNAVGGQTWMLDKDFIAVDYAQRNAALNGLTNVSATLSNGLAAVRDKPADLVASNLPAKVGKELLYLFLADARHMLNPGGRLYVVTITGLRRFIERNFNEVFGNYTKVKQGKDYTVALAKKQ
mgnify:CR=1 FL=1